MMRTRSILVLCALAGAATTPRLAAAATPSTLTYTARFQQGGAPMTGTHAFTFSLWSAPAGGTFLWGQSASLAVDDGLLDVPIGDASLPATFAGQAVFLQVTVDNNDLSPRIEIASVPYAMTAGTAHELGDYAPADLQETLASPCPAGTALAGVQQDGTRTCVAAPAIGGTEADSDLTIGPAPTVVHTVNLTLPASGKLVVLANLEFHALDTVDGLTCELRLNNTAFATAHFDAVFDREDTNTIVGVPFGFVSAGPQTLTLVCTAIDGDVVNRLTSRLIARYYPLPL